MIAEALTSALSEPIDRTASEAIDRAIEVPGPSIEAIDSSIEAIDSSIEAIDSSIETIGSSIEAIPSGRVLESSHA